MKNQFNSSAKIFLSVIAVLGWFALILQFYIHMANGNAGVAELLMRFFTYFTIITNIVIAFCSTVLLLSPHSKAGMFFSKQSTLAAIVVYIAIVAVIYNTILRYTWQPTGFHRVADELLHLVIPVLYIVFWGIFVPKNELRWKQILPWLIYPLLYTIIVLLRGIPSGFYPYPFMDVNKLGTQQTFINCLGVTAAFVVVSVIVVGISKVSRKGAKGNA